MRDRLSLSRRALLRGASIGVTGSIAGCSATADLFPEPGGDGSGPQSTAGPITGRVTGTGGEPIGNASVEALGPGSERLAAVRTGNRGRFSLDPGRPVWLRVRADDYTERVIAGAPGDSYSVELTPSRGTAVLSFGGDVMFARRFYEDNTDHLTSRARIRPESRLEDHRGTLGSVRPLLESADLTSVNLETPLTTRGWRHPSKRYAYASHPTAAEALADAGIDYTALGNNHVFDALGPGLRDTVGALDAAGISHSGAGLSADDAWEPAARTAAGVRVALVSCTTLVGNAYDLNWSADRDRGAVTVETDDGSITVPPGVGVAEATPGRLADRVGTAGRTADVVVVQIHGGEPYRPIPTGEMRTLTAAAAGAGADLVVNHHPHVVGGLDRIGSTPVAWSLGNLVFDQTLWPTFPTYLLTAHVDADGVRRLHADPLLIEGFVPRGVVAKPNRFVAWSTAARSTPRASITGSGLTLSDAAGPVERDRERVTLSGDGTIYARETGWVAGVPDGSVRLGTDLLPTGSFESIDVDDVGYDGALWRFGRDPRRSVPDRGTGTPAGSSSTGSADTPPGRYSRTADGSRSPGRSPCPFATGRRRRDSPSKWRGIPTRRTPGSRRTGGTSPRPVVTGSR